MKLLKFVLYMAVGICLLVSISCRDEKKDEFSGVSNLLSDRNKARYNRSGNLPPSKNNVEQQQQRVDNNSGSVPNKKKEPLVSDIIYKKDVSIRDSKSGKILTTGVAYVDENGRIIKIKIKR